MADKRGQFFLIAAIIIIVVVVSVVTITNYTQRKDVVKLYDLGQELGIESRNVLDYGTYSELNETQMKILMENFIKNYVNYIGETGNLYFLFGNSQKINAIAYQHLTNESVCVKLNPPKYSYPEDNTECIPIVATGTTQELSPATGEISRVAIRIAENEYQFKLKLGENFYFVIWQKIGGEKHVITSEEEK
jgi:hypothetical protein